MNNKSAVAAGLVITLLLVTAVGGLYFYGQKKMIRDSLKQFTTAKTFYETSRWPQAEALFGEVVRKYPRSDVAPESMYYVAMIMHAGGRYEEALEKWRALAQVEDSPRAVEVDYYIGRCLERLGRKAEAVSKYTPVAATYQAGEFASLAKAGLARIAESEDRLEEARTLYEEAMALVSTPEAFDLAERPLGDLNLRMFTRPREGEHTEAYLVKPGDSMVRIALKHNTTVDLLCKINNIQDPARVRPNKRVLIPNSDFSIVVDKSDFKLTLYNHDRFFTSYKVGLGKHGCTPEGDFVIGDKIKNPTWWSDEGPIPPGDPRNELSTRWMALKPLTSGIGTDYGIHGTIDPSTIGWESSNGCPRMYREEAEELYMLVTIGTPVKIVQ
ncbi:MAG: L,D-transpeptidase family protein [Candidatus Hydrogenedentota bacterium]|nr:MAG: L,D-transpeptidase family protein [Candidatus Hydrogenedentota bacterium]